MHRFNLIPEQSEDDDSLLGIYLTTPHPDEHSLRELITEHYGKDIFRLILAVFDDRWQVQPNPDFIYIIYENILNEAIKNVNHFTQFGETRIWLFNHACKLILRKYRIVKLKERLKLPPTPHSKIQYILRSPSIAEESQPFFRYLDHLTPTERLIFVLLHSFDLSNEQICKILEESPRPTRKIYKNIVLPRKRNPVKQQNIIKTVKSVSEDRYDSNLYFDRFRFSHQAKTRAKDLPGPRTIQVDWIYVRDSIVLISLFLCTIIVISYFRAVEPIADSQTRLSPYPSTPIPISASATFIASVKPIGLGNTMGPAVLPLLYISEPSISHDGRFLAFSSSLDFLLPGDTNRAADIFVFDRQTRTFERVNVSNSGTQTDNFSYSPGISADGRWITFVSLASNLVKGSSGVCSDSDSNINCSMIYLHDRLNDTTIPVSRVNDGNSYAPTISANGRWIVYWSEVDNLPFRDKQPCGSGQAIRSCVDIFIYDRQSGQTERIPIGRDSTNAYLEPVSISDEGLLLALTIYSSDRIASNIQLDHQSDSFIYNRQIKAYSHINHSSSGDSGNQSSFNAKISAQGDRVTFVSRANNLMDKDDNNTADIFLYDNIAETTHLVSQNSSGVVGNAESGTSSMPGFTGWGEPLSVSADGRYIAYLSHADNLSDQLANRCGHPGKTVCRNIYVFDSFTGKTELILPGRGRDSYYSYTILSGDGRWLAIVEQYLMCPVSDLCTELWLYDLENNDLQNPIRNHIAYNQQQPYYWPDLSLSHGSSVNALVFSPDASIVASGANDGTIRLWRTSDWSLMNILDAHHMPVSDLVITADGKKLISASTNGTIYTWRLPQGTLDSHLIHSSDPILGLALSRDGSHLAAVGQGSLWQWDITEEGIILSDAQKYPGAVLYDIAYSPDSSLIAIAANDATVWLYSPIEEKIITRLGGHVGKVLSIDFSPDGTWLASGGMDNSIIAWKLSQTESWNIKIDATAFIIHPNWINQLLFLPGTNTLASTALDNSVYLWNLSEGEQVTPGLRIRIDEVISVATPPDGNMIIAGTIGGYIHTWGSSDEYIQTFR